MSAPRRAAAPLAVCALALAAACAPKRAALPSGAGTSFPEAAPAYQTAIQECRGARTLQATLGLSGRAGSTGIRGSVDAGFEAPAQVRLEGRYPFGRPAFILVAAGPQATLYLPRDNRVLRNATTETIVEALVGLPLGGGEMRAVLTGCGFGASDSPGAGRSYPGGWAAIDTDGATTYLRQVEGRWRIVGATRPPLMIHYSGFTLGRASTVRVSSTGPVAADVTVRLSDVTINVALGTDVFSVQVPPEAEPLTIEELRRAGPLSGR
jgi:hypothetical protein